MTQRICIEASPALQRQAGIGRYALNLIRALLSAQPDGDFAIGYNLSDSAALPKPLGSMPAYTSTLENKSWRLRNAITHFGAPPMDPFFDGVALYHSTGHLLPRLRHIRTVLTLHDLIPLLKPQFHRPLNHLFLRLMLPRFLHRADAIIAVSENTKKDAVALLGADPEHITVIPEGISDEFRPVHDKKQLEAVRAAYGLPHTFILCVSTIEPRKNHITLLRAFEMLHPEYPHVALVLAGRRGWLYHGFLDPLANSSARHHVRMLGEVPEHDLPVLLSAATVFAFPSLYEGFGLPPLEAMACSTPVVCSNASSLPEVVGDAAMLCDPTDAIAWRTAITHFLSNEDWRREMASHGLKRAAGFRWDSVAHSTRAVYDSTLNT